MTRAYLRLDPDFSHRKAAYPDGPYRALIDAFCAAESEPKRGYFRSLPVLKAVLGRSARHLPYLFEHGDLQSLTDGRVYVVGWNEWQEGDWQVAERMRRVRARREGENVTPVTPTTVTTVTPPTVSRPSSGGGKRLAVSGGGGGDSAATAPTPAHSSNGQNATRLPVMVVIDWLEQRTGRPYNFGEGSKVHDCLSPDVRDFGADAVIAAMTTVAAGMQHPDIGQIVFSATRVLHPITSPAPDEEPDPAEVKRQLHERRQRKEPANA